jgi:L-ascorbate metabolism protein UlaG (beta-lactamase superfamily)
MLKRLQKKRARLSRFGALALALGFAAALAGKAKAGEISVTWLGHATFEVVSPGGTTLLLDPFITKNPKTPKAMKDLARYKPDAILLTHSHFDHTADAVAIAKASGAKVIGVSDHLRGMDLDKKAALRGNPGGKHRIGDVTVHLVPAMHASAPGGRPVGFVIEFADGRTLYDTGDTWIFGDMALIQEIFQPEIILLQAGGGPYNQEPKIAALAIKKYFDPKVIIPMHYGTWPILAGEDEVERVFGADPRVRIMQPGETVKF